ncbi:hypothetical protein SGPA1_11327 [Streptomyces misionensis JCM 4497]
MKILLHPRGGHPRIDAEGVARLRQGWRAETPRTEYPGSRGGFACAQANTRHPTPHRSFVESVGSRGGLRPSVNGGRTSFLGPGKGIGEQ